MEIAVIAARPLTSLVSTLLRFYEMNAHGTVPRATAMEAHDHIVEVLPRNLDTLQLCISISQLSIWDRELRQLYCSSLQEEVPSQVLTEYWDRPWEESELQETRAQINELQRKEAVLALGQGTVIQELRARLDEVQMAESPSFHLEMNVL